MKYPKLTLFCIFCPFISGIIYFIFAIFFVKFYNTHYNPGFYSEHADDIQNIPALFILISCILYPLSSFPILLNIVQSVRESVIYSFLSFYLGPLTVFLYLANRLGAENSKLISGLAFFILLQTLAFILFRKLYGKGSFA
jgi:hypothetical protein